MSIHLDKQFKNEVGQLFFLTPACHVNEIYKTHMKHLFGTSESAMY